MATALICVAGGVLALWGAMHIVATRPVADSFGEISADNRRILVMEWIAEGVSHISIGVLVVLSAVVEGAGDPTVRLVDRVAAAALIVLAALTTFTGARTPVIWFKICPFVLTGAAALLLVAGWV